jgi:cephalosporin hydroxylase
VYDQVNSHGSNGHALEPGVGPTNRPCLDAFHLDYYNSGVWQRTTWLGAPATKYPSDLIAYQEVLWQSRSDLVVGCGAYLGGTAQFFATLCDLVGRGRVLAIDPAVLPGRPRHGRLTYLLGASTAPATLEYVGASRGEGTCVIVLDSGHP